MWERISAISTLWNTQNDHSFDEIFATKIWIFLIIRFFINKVDFTEFLQNKFYIQFPPPYWPFYKYFSKYICHHKTISMTSNLLDQLISRFLPWKTVFFSKLLGRWKKYDILRSSVNFKENVCEIKSFRHDFRPDLVTFSLNFHRFEHSALMIDFDW